MALFKDLVGLTFKVLPLPEEKFRNVAQNEAWFAQLQPDLSICVADVANLISPLDASPGFSVADVLIELPDGSSVPLGCHCDPNGDDCRRLCEAVAADLAPLVSDDPAFAADGKWLELVKQYLPQVLQLILLFVK